MEPKTLPTTLNIDSALKLRLKELCRKHGTTIKFQITRSVERAVRELEALMQKRAKQRTKKGNAPEPAKKLGSVKKGFSRRRKR